MARVEARVTFVIACDNDYDYDAQDAPVPGIPRIWLLFRWLLWLLAIRATYSAVLNREWLAVRAAYPEGLPGSARPGAITSTKKTGQCRKYLQKK
ncbi:MAG: hypothetical protein CVV41_03600 [Candidatus Riflebacteria bacterium HGW-Riflebacteria-1]|nr:MAG: hypothetical protein CVV41_03600 [Candidatus Riflebacteria bacterium HGW-Riflebacteria-1]